ncbi:MAG: aminoglycoside phosphotransferase family protein [Pirellula sp.]|jgi:aminoglycoside phosphotransferase (APT) family kinase protein|nr:aminoglycoside phosphotransferase family protein [Pirellula sp.]
MDFAILTLLKRAIRSRFYCEAEHIVQLGGGFSGTPIIQFSIESQRWVARGWPRSPESQTKIDNWGKIARHLEERASELKPWFEFSPIPRPVPWNASIDNTPLALQIGENLWTLARWVPGEPLKANDVTYEFLRGYVEQLAVLHRLIRETQHSPALSSGLIERRNLLVDIQRELSEIAHECSHHPLRNELAPFLIKCTERSRIWLPTIDSLANRAGESHWILRDLWRDNLLVDSDKRWIHTVDVGASRIDWPAFDFIRMVGSLLEPSDELEVRSRWQQLLDTYIAINPHSEMPSAKELHTIHQVSTALSIIFWARNIKEHNAAPELLAARTHRMRELLKIFCAN